MPKNIKGYAIVEKKSKQTKTIIAPLHKKYSSNTKSTKTEDASKSVKKGIKAPSVLAPPTPLVVPLVTTGSMSKEEFYEKMFGKKQSPVKNLVVPLIVNNKFGRNTRLNIIDGKHYVAIDDLKNVLIRFLPQELLAKIFDKKNISKYGLDIKTLHSFGMDSYFNDEDVIVYISISPEVRLPTKLKFASNYKEMDEEFEKIVNSKSSKISGVSNFYAKDSFYNMIGSDSLERRAASLSNKTFVNYNDYIFNSGFIVNEQKNIFGEEQKDLFNRDYTYLSKDIPTNNDRYSLGDVSLVGLNHMPMKSVLGFSLVHHYNITRRIQNSMRVTEKEIFLKNESQMEIRVNDILVRTMTLQPGIHHLSDFPLIAGNNNVKIKLTDIFGETQEIDFNDFYYADLLKRGVYTYGISAGIGIVDNLAKGIVYEEDKKYLSGNFNMGLCKNTTLNTGIQVSNNLYAYENELFIGTNYGLFSTYGVLSKYDGLDYGYKYGYSYHNIFDKTSINVSKHIVDKNYRTILSNILSDTSAETFNATINTTFKNGIQLGASYANRFLLGNDIEVKKFTYNHRLSSRWNLKLDLQESKTNTLKPWYGAMLTLRYTPYRSNVDFLTSVERENASGKYETNTRAAININKNGAYGLDSSYEYENYENSSKKDSIRFKYTDASYTVNSNYSEVIADNGSKSKLGNINLATAIAFVDNEYAITKPVSNSFILVKNDDVFSEEPLGIKSYNSNNPSSKFVMPTPDYDTRKISVDVKNLAFGIDLKQTDFEISSKYKEGSLVEISPKFIFTPKGILHDRNNKPLSMKVFKVFKVQKDGTKNVIEENPIIFTNSKGKFIIANVEEGDYFVKEINTEYPYIFNFSIQKQKSNGGLIDIGIIKPDGGPIIKEKINLEVKNESNKLIKSVNDIILKDQEKTDIVNSELYSLLSESDVY